MSGHGRRCSRWRTGAAWRMEMGNVMQWIWERRGRVLLWAGPGGRRDHRVVPVGGVAAGIGKRVDCGEAGLRGAGGCWGGGGGALSALFHAESAGTGGDAVAGAAIDLRIRVRVPVACHRGLVCTLPGVDGIPFVEGVLGGRGSRVPVRGRRIRERLDALRGRARGPAVVAADRQPVAAPAGCA